MYVTISAEKHKVIITERGTERVITVEHTHQERKGTEKRVSS